MFRRHMPDVVVAIGLVAVTIVATGLAVHTPPSPIGDPAWASFALRPRVTEDSSKWVYVDVRHREDTTRLTLFDEHGELGRQTIDLHGAQRIDHAAGRPGEWLIRFSADAHGVDDPAKRSFVLTACRDAKGNPTTALHDLPGGDAGRRSLSMGMGGAETEWTDGTRPSGFGSAGYLIPCPVHNRILAIEPVTDDSRGTVDVVAYERTGDERTGDERTGDGRTGDGRTGDGRTGDERTVESWRRSVGYRTAVRPASPEGVVVLPAVPGGEEIAVNVRDGTPLPPEKSFLLRTPESVVLNGFGDDWRSWVGRPAALKDRGGPPRCGFGGDSPELPVVGTRTWLSDRHVAMRSVVDGGRLQIVDIVSDRRIVDFGPGRWSGYSVVVVLVGIAALVFATGRRIRKRPATAPVWMAAASLATAAVLIGGWKAWPERTWFSDPPTTQLWTATSVAALSIPWFAVVTRRGGMTRRWWGAWLALAAGLSTVGVLFPDVLLGERLWWVARSISGGGLLLIVLECLPVVRVDDESEKGRLSCVHDSPEAVGPVSDRWTLRDALGGVTVAAAVLAAWRSAWSDASVVTVIDRIGVAESIDAVLPPAVLGGATVLMLVRSRRIDVVGATAVVGVCGFTAAVVWLSARFGVSSSVSVIRPWWPMGLGPSSRMIELVDIAWPAMVVGIVGGWWLRCCGLRIWRTVPR